MLDNLELLILYPLPLKCWDYWHATPCPVCAVFLGLVAQGLVHSWQALHQHLQSHVNHFKPCTIGEMLGVLRMLCKLFISKFCLFLRPKLSIHYTLTSHTLLCWRPGKLAFYVLSQLVWRLWVLHKSEIIYFSFFVTVLLHLMWYL